MAVNLLDEKFFMVEALKEAFIALEKDEVPIGAVVVCDNIIIARSHNLTETLQDVTAHAEILACTSASAYLGSKYLTQCTMYVTLEPCAMCAGALYWAQLNHLVFGANDVKRGFSIFNNQLLHPSTKVTKGIMQSECENILKDFFIKKRI